MSDFRNRMLKAKSNVQAPSYKRLYISLSQGKEYSLRFLDPKVIDGEGLPFSYVYLHGNYMHPNFDQKYPSNFRCGGKGCALCADARALAKEEKENDVPKKERQAFKKQARKYAIYWAINEDNQELTLVHVPDFSYSESEETLNTLLTNKILELDEMGLKPFDLKEGLNVVISTTVVDSKIKFSINEDSTSIREVPQLIIKKLEQLKPLSQVYKKYSPEELEAIAAGRKIPSGKEKEETQAKEEKSLLQKEEQSISEENFNFEDDDSELKDLLEGHAVLDDEDDSGDESLSLSERMKRLSSIGNQGSEE